MPRSTTTRTRVLFTLSLGMMCAGALPSAGCSVHAGFQAGTTSGSGRTSSARPKSSDDAREARERARRRRADEDMARIDREAKERVAEAEREAAEREREAEAEAQREREQAAADAEQRKREAAEAAAKQAATKKRRATTGRFDMGTPDADKGDDVFERRTTEIKSSEDEKKAAIRKKLEQNKSDILVAAERKRSAVQESLKDQPEKKP
jgi:colicin import membrane protein